MARIWKIKLEKSDVQKIELPGDFTFLSLQTQNGEPTIWFWVPDTTKKEKSIVKLRTVGTGNQFPKDVKVENYVGTYLMASDSLVFHVFVIPERTCVGCGCTENDCRQCIQKTGEPCYWVSDDLCSACHELNS